MPTNKRARLQGQVDRSNPQNETASESFVESLTESQRIQDLLQGESQNCIVHYYPRLDSTQDKAAQLAKQGAAHETLIVAGEQLAGRGRHQRQWWHDAKNGLAFTLVVRPDLAAAQAPGLVFVAALALRQALLLAGLEVRIKWPNDLVVEPGGDPGQERRKLAGILSQASLRGDRLGYALIGIGLNVNTPAKAFAEQARVASSLFVETGKKCNKYNVLADFCKRFAAQLRRLQQQGLAGILDDIRPCSATLGQRIQAQIDGQMQQVQALDFAEDGALIVRLDSGEKRQIFEAL